MNILIFFIRFIAIKRYKMENKKDAELGQRKRLLIGIAIVATATIGVYGYFKYDEIFPTTDNAYIDGNLINVATKVSGYIASINVKDNQYAHKGDLLLTLDPKDYQVNLEQAKQNYRSQVEMAKMAKWQVEVQKKQIKKDGEQLNFLKERRDRFEALYKSNVVSLQDYQQATTDCNTAVTGIAMDNDKYTQFLSGYQYALAKVDVAKANLDNANNNLEYTKYYAPSNGYVTNLTTLSTGELINTGQQVFAIVDTSNWWITANFKETQLARIKPGQKVSINLDMYHHTYSGVVQSVSHASGNTFSLLPAQNATGNWVKVTQRFSVLIKIEDNAEYPLRIGASSKVKINTL